MSRAESVSAAGAESTLCDDEMKCVAVEFEESARVLPISTFSAI